MKKFLSLLLILCGLILLIIIFKPDIYRLKPASHLTITQKIVLLNHAKEAKLNGDLPISSLLIYNGKIIGQGFNTVERDSDLTGHAEINALRDAINKTSLDSFMKLDGNNLKIISTLEPCEMCKGVLLHYNIKNVEFLKDKSLYSDLYRNYNEFRYELNKKQISSSDLLDSLAILHPDY